MGGGTLHPNPPIGVISDSNQSGLILILTWLSLSFVLVSFAIRVHIRCSKGLWKLDDNILTAATVLACAQTSVIVRAVKAGLGDNQLNGVSVVQKFYFSSHYLYIFELFLSKVAIAALYFRLTRARNHRLAIWTILASCVIWLIMSIFLLSIRYSWPSAFTIPFSRWLSIGVIDAITDVALSLMSVYLVKNLQLSRQRKGIVIVAFGVRLLTIIPCALRLYYLHPDAIPHNRGLAISLAIVCTQLQVGYAVMAASVAVLKPFMVVYDKSPHPSYPSNSAAVSHPSRSYYKNTKEVANPKSAARSKTASFKMQSLRSQQSIKSTKSMRGDDGDGMVVGSNHDQIGPLSGRSTRIITSGPFERKNSITSNESQKKMIIERRDEWSIKYEDDIHGAIDGANALPGTAASGSGVDGDSSLSYDRSESVSNAAAASAWAPGGIGVAK